MITSNKKRIKLQETKSLQEALTALNQRKAHPAIKTMVTTAHRLADEKEKLAMLQEAENLLIADEKKMAESIKVAPGENNRVSGKSAQSDGQTLEEIDDKNPPGEDGSKPAPSIPGVSQLSEMVDTMGGGMMGGVPQQTADMGSVDPMNICVIEKMNMGMSEVEAQNACSREMQFSEAVFVRTLNKIGLPKMMKLVAQNQEAFQEAINIMQNDDKKGTINLHKQEKQQPGFAEGVIPPGNSPTTALQKLDTPEDIANFRKDFKNRYDHIQ